MGSGAGSNLLNAFLLNNVTPNTASNGPGGSANPAPAYGTFGPGGNDSGGFAAEIRAFKAYKFQVTQLGITAVSGYEISIYYTVDPNAYQTFVYAMQGQTYNGQSALPFGGSCNALADRASGFYPGIPAGSWTLLDGLSDQSGAGLSANPIVPASSFMFTGNGPVVALRAVVTGISSPQGVFNLSLLGIP